MNLKERYNRFKVWQRDPMHYNYSKLPAVRCANCGAEVEGSFCPVCGQRRNVGRVGWDTVRQNIAVIWGMDSRSFSYTILQLFLRPGYLINDYISGKRQLSFPPVKMLLIVAAIAYLLEKVSSMIFPEVDVAVTSNSGDLGLLDNFLDWVENNPGWGMLAISSFLIQPTWLLFRHAPRNKHHTLPEGFFIQVFIATLMLLIIVISSLTLGSLGWLILVYFVITYMQLFGYGLWGTIWRVVLCLLAAAIMFTFVFAVLDRLMGMGNKTVEHSIISEVITLLLFVLVFIGFARIAVHINRHTERK